MSDDARNGDQVQQNFFEWKEAVGLPPSFPALRVLANEELSRDKLFYANAEQSRKVDEIVERAGGSLVHVHLTDGQGCTTLSRLIYRELFTTALVRRLIPVRLAIEDVQAEYLLEHPLDVIQDAMRRDIVLSMATKNWHFVIGEEKYARIIGAKSADAEVWSAKKSHLKSLVDNHDEQLKSHVAKRSEDKDVGPNEDLSSQDVDETRLDRTESGFFDLKALNGVAPILAQTIDEVLADLATTFSIRVLLLVDLSSPYSRRDPTRYDQMIASLQRGIKALHQRDMQKKNPTYPTVLNEMYFGHKTAFDVLQYGWPRDWSTVRYPGLKQVDIFAMFSRYHYPQTDRQEGLASVMYDSLLEDATGVVLAETVAKLHGRFRFKLSKHDNIPYHINLGEDTDTIRALEEKIFRTERDFDKRMARYALLDKEAGS